MKKTIEEIRKAVLAYCEDVCPDKLRTSIECGSLAWGYVDSRDSEYEAWFLYVGNANSSPISLFALTADAVWIAAYRLLGLEARDAVEAYKSENERLQSAWMAEKSRNAALVAAGKALVAAVKVGMPITESIIHQLVEFEKALAANNTEKGGVQG